MCYLSTHLDPVNIIDKDSRAIYSIRYKYADDAQAWFFPVSEVLIMSQRRENSLLGPYRVLDLSDEKGVLCGKILADLGADVIKVEPPGGDPMRHIAPFCHDTPDPEKSLYWFTFNTSKRSVTLDITRTDGQEIFKKLVKTADFVIECFPPGYLDRLGLGYPVLSELNPRLVMTSITSFGQSGPYRDYKASDIVGLALGGLMYLTGEPDRPPVRIRAQQGYAQASVQAAAGTMIAHYYREVSGEGQHVDISMQEAVSNTMDTAQQAWDLQEMIYKRAAPFRPLGERLVRCVYPCKDGYVACWTPETLASIAEWMESAGVEFDREEMNRWIELREKIAAGEITIGKAFTEEELARLRELRLSLFELHTRQEIYDKALTKGFGWASVNTPKDLLENKQLEARDYFIQVEHPELNTSITYPGAPCKISETPWRVWNRAPLIGEHNEEIYAGELGMTKEKLSTLKQERVI